MAIVPNPHKTTGVLGWIDALGADSFAHLVFDGDQGVHMRSPFRWCHGLAAGRC